MILTPAKVAAVGILAVTLTAAASAPAIATPGYADQIQYYSDDTYTVVVGEAGDDCDGNTYQSGEVTAFKLHILAPCNDTGGPFLPDPRG